MAAKAVKPGKFRLYHPWYSRHQVSKIDAFFIFGDNVEERGSGPKSGQAVIRGLPNAIGIKTKWRPDMEVGAFFSDEDERCANYMYVGWCNVIHTLVAGNDVYYPAAGIGTGRSQLKLYAPGLYNAVEHTVNVLLRKYGEDPFNL